LLWDALEIELHGRKLPDRMLLALADVAIGLRTRNSSYRKAADISDQVASRDLKILVDQGLLTPGGEKRGRYYQATPFLLEIRSKCRQVKEMPNPFVDHVVSPKQLTFRNMT
jgi:hypothetical protein